MGWGCLCCERREADGSLAMEQFSEKFSSRFSASKQEGPIFQVPQWFSTLRARVVVRGASRFVSAESNFCGLLKQRVTFVYMREAQEHAIWPTHYATVHCHCQDARSALSLRISYGRRSLEVMRIDSIISPQFFCLVKPLLMEPTQRYIPYFMVIFRSSHSCWLLDFGA